MSAWTTQRGDEWTYSTSWGRAVVAAGPVVTIDAIEPVDHQLSTDRVHEVLWSAWQEFQGSPLLCTLAGGLGPYLDELARQGLVRWELVEQPFGRDARLLDVLPPSS